ncbi:MAG: preprotein translocase subunit SecY [bacterium]|nr:preprotein translocase subunit SecY [bacterium]
MPTRAGVMLDTLKTMWKVREVRNAILFVLGMLAIFRFLAHIPVPGVDVAALEQFFASSAILGLLNVFSGGTMENFSIVALGVAPFITASIIFQLLGMVIPAIEELQKEGEYGRRKINQYTRLLSIPLSIMQGFGLMTLVRQSNAAILPDLSIMQTVMLLTTVTAGTVFLMWLGELISEKNVGNGISLMIFAGIISILPQAVQQTALTFDVSRLVQLLVFVILAIVTIIGVVALTEAQRNIPVSYARRVRGMRMVGGLNTHLPLRVNMAGVIPIIFAISIILFPPLLGQFFIHAKTAWIARGAELMITIFQNQVFYGIAYFSLVFIFTFFYTAVVFHPQQIAENLQKQGGFIPGIRPGRATAEYLQFVTNRIIFFGAASLGLIAILPILTQPLIPGAAQLTTIVGGTSLLIIVSVVIESVKQVGSQLTMREYEGL